MRKGVDLRRLALVLVNAAQARKSVDTVNVHRTRSANALSARPTESQGRVDLVLDFDLARLGCSRPTSIDIPKHRASLVHTAPDRP